MKRLFFLFLLLVATTVSAQVWEEVPNTWSELSGGDPLPLGSVTSVGISAPVEMTVSGSPVTTSGTLALAWANQLKNLVLASPDNASGILSMRAMVPRDLGASVATGLCLKGTSATVMDWAACGGGGTTIANDTIWAAAGDLVYATGNDAATVLPAGTATQLLHSGATPAWGAVDLATAQVTGLLPHANIANGSNISVFGRSANSAGVMAPIQCTAASDAVVRESGSALGCGTIATAGIGASQVTYAKVQNSSVGLTVLGRSVNSSGALGEIAASAASDCAFRESASTVGCGTLATAAYATASVTLAKQADVAGGSFGAILGRQSGTGVQTVIPLSANQFNFIGGSLALSGEQGGNGSSCIQNSANELLTLSTSGTTTDTTANLLPVDSIILAVEGRVTTTITTATSWQLGDPTTAARFSTANSTMTSGATISGRKHWSGSVTTDAAGPTQDAAAKVRVTTVGTPGAGVVRIYVYYIQCTAPTS